MVEFDADQLGDADDLIFVDAHGGLAAAALSTCGAGHRAPVLPVAPRCWVRAVWAAAKTVISWTHDLLLMVLEIISKWPGGWTKAKFEA
jgi:hypothetical protein